MSFKDQLRINYINSRGWKTKRRILVIESDDWGGIRMPSKAVLTKAEELGLPVNTNPYNKFDTIASGEDFEHLFSVLSKHKDSNGRNPVITANVVLCNPDFSKIRESKFQEFFVEDFFETVKKYYPNQDVLSFWQQGLESKLFFPQYHGREHVNAFHWLRALQNKHPLLTQAFELGFWGLDKEAYTKEVGLNLQATYDAKHVEELVFHKASLLDGLARFKKHFGFASKSFIPNNFVFDKKLLLADLRENDVRFIQGKQYHLNPSFYPKKERVTPRFLGMQNGMVNLVRNCTFEPSQMKTKEKVIQDCLNEISNAFFWNKPAILTAHRLNFIGTIDVQNRMQNLALLDVLLMKVIDKYPNVEFLNSAELGEEIYMKTNTKK